MLSTIIFIIIAGGALAYAGYQFNLVRQNILLASDEAIEGPSGERWKNMLLVAFGQKKMFKKIIPAVLHFILYAAFVITQIELIEIFIDGVLHKHRFFASSLGGFYTFMISFIEVLSLLAFVATVIFLVRRNALYIPRFSGPEMRGWPKLDANLILIFELILLVCIFTMNGTDIVLQNRGEAYYPATGSFAVSGWLGPLVFGNFSTATLVVLERIGWWGHLLMVLWFLNYLPSSKHLHILLAFPNTYFSRLEPKGEMDNMPAIMKEVKSMMDPDAPMDEADMSEELPEFGANDIFGLNWLDTLGAYSCTQCGRCTEQCPANITGKKLSPRKIVMDVRTRTEEVARNIRSGNEEFCKDPAQPLSKDNYDDGKTLWDYISKEEIHACTTCNACVEACPVLINPLRPILAMRRHEILTESAGPADWLPLFNSIENAQAAWSMGKSRKEWVDQ
ncbi:Fe-S oxidoreductase [Lewinellaceae bacterium SD302]|nr:Fe-S oxidoreductase [Lewinellaceae bacterium SD302]